MKALSCPKCGGPVYVLETRYLKTTTAIRRSRKCDMCGYKYTTYELSAEKYEKYIESIRKLDKIELLVDALREVMKDDD